MSKDFSETYDLSKKKGLIAYLESLVKYGESLQKEDIDWIKHHIEKGKKKK